MIMSSRVYRCTRELPYSAPNSAGHFDLLARDSHYIPATSVADALLQMAAKFPLDVMRTKPEDAFTADCLEEKYARASFEEMAVYSEPDSVETDIDELLENIATLTASTIPPSDNNPTLVDLTEAAIADFAGSTVPPKDSDSIEVIFSDAPERVDMWR